MIFRRHVFAAPFQDLRHPYQFVQKIFGSFLKSRIEELSMAIEGFLYESIGGRTTVEVAPHVRLNAGYARDKNNRDDQPTERARSRSAQRELRHD